MWKEGSLNVNDSVFHYRIKLNDTRSELCINGGKVLVLKLKRNGKLVCKYDKGWKAEPVDLDSKIAVEMLSNYHNY